jgi:hypothetical protein
MNSLDSFSGGSKPLKPAVYGESKVCNSVAPSGGLCDLPVSTSGFAGLAMLKGVVDEDFKKPIASAKKKVVGLGHAKGLCGFNDIRAGKPKMEPAVNLAVVGVVAPSLKKSHYIVLDNSFLLCYLLNGRQKHQLQSSPEVLGHRPAGSLGFHHFELNSSPTSDFVSFRPNCGHLV